MVLEVVNAVVPETLGGSADLTGSNNTLTKDLGVFDAENRGGRYVHYGIREHGMSAAMNGIAKLHGATAAPSSLRLCPRARCVSMGTRVVYVLTHDSIGLGEDGPTHQPVEIPPLRAPCRT